MPQEFMRETPVRATNLAEREEVLSPILWDPIIDVGASKQAFKELAGDEILMVKKEREWR